MTPADFVIPALLVAWLAGSIWIDRLRHRAADHRSVFAEATADAARGNDPMKGNVTHYHVAMIGLLLVTVVLILLAERFLG